MNSGQLSDLLLTGLGVTTAAAFVVAYFRAKTGSNTMNAAKDTIEIQTDKIVALEGKSKDQDEAIYNSEQKIKDLEHEINIIKVLPLQQLSADYSQIASTLTLMTEHVGKVNTILEEQGKILNFFYETYHQWDGVERRTSNKARRSKS